MAGWRHSTVLGLTIIAIGWLTVDDVTEAQELVLGGTDLYRQRETWEPVHDANANVSAFVYRDSNRNGSYDMGDLPLAGIGMELQRPDGSNVVRRSNVYGFVNFTNSLTAAPVDVDTPGQYRFEVLAPPGWQVTSGNAMQTGRYSQDPASRPAIVIDRVPAPVGLAQALTVSGRVEQPDGSGEAERTRVTALSPEGAERAVEVDEDGRFVLPASPGDWTIRVRFDEDQSSVTRRVRVADGPVALSPIVADRHYAERGRAGEAITVDFDSITPMTATKVPAGVAGLAWTNLIAIQADFYRGEGYLNTNRSGKYVGYNTSGYPVTVESDEPFNFHGAWLGVAWSQAEGETLEITAWRGDRKVVEDELTLSAFGPVWFEAGYRDITRLELATRHYWQFVIDDPVFSK